MEDGGWRMEDGGYGGWRMGGGTSCAVAFWMFLVMKGDAVWNTKCAPAIQPSNDLMQGAPCKSRQLASGAVQLACSRAARCGTNCRNLQISGKGPWPTMPRELWCTLQAHAIAGAAKRPSPARTPTDGALAGVCAGDRRHCRSLRCAVCTWHGPTAEEVSLEQLQSLRSAWKRAQRRDLDAVAERAHRGAHIVLTTGLPRGDTASARQVRQREYKEGVQQAGRRARARVCGACGG